MAQSLKIRTRMAILQIHVICVRLLICVTMLLCVTGCRHTTDKSNDPQTTSTYRHARLLCVSEHEGYTLATIANPWKDGAILHRYILVSADSALPEGLPEGTVVRTPLQRALVYSSVHTGLLKEMGAQNAVAGIVDAQYFKDNFIKQGLKDGTIADCGSSFSPTIEKVIALHPDAILLSPYQDASYGQITQLDVPIIECADYMEYTPLGRAEWMRFYGKLFGCETAADSLFSTVADAYNGIAQRAASFAERPTVLTEMVINGIWNLPGGQSYMARIIHDAGGQYLWEDDDHTGSLSLDFNTVLAKAKNAQFWFIKWTKIQRLEDVKGAYELNSHFDAYKQGRVYVCDTDNSGFFDIVPFHPDLLLKEFAAILHPDLDSTYVPRFYHHLPH